jgi:hypothetical protein
MTTMIRMRHLQRGLSRRRRRLLTIIRPSSTSAAGTVVEDEDIAPTGAAFKFQKIQQWSLRKLAETNNVKDADQVTRLLQDISLRLYRQIALCRQLTDIVEDLSRWGKRLPASRQPNNNNNHKNPNVISTSSHLAPYWWNQTQQDRQTEEIKAARKNLADLEILHRNTLELAQVSYHQMNQTQQHQSSQRSKSNMDHMLSTMKQIHARHANTIENMADLVIGLRPVMKSSQHQQQQSVSLLQIEPTIHAFLQGRLGVQLLCDHLIQLCKGRPNGAIAMDCSIHEVLTDAITEATQLCEAHYLSSPPVFILESSLNDLTATLVKPWIHYALVELLKNSMAVTVEQAGGVYQQPLDEDDNPATHPLYITLEQTENNLLLIHIHDQGGGICQQRRKQGKSIDVDSLFAFAQSRRKWDRLQDQQTYAMTRSPLQGLGVGLSLSRIMMRHLGGDLQLVDRLDPVSLSLHETVELEKGVTTTIAWNQNLDFVEAGLWSDEWKHLEPADDSQL